MGKRYSLVRVHFCLNHFEAGCVLEAEGRINVILTNGNFAHCRYSSFPHGVSQEKQTHAQRK